MREDIWVTANDIKLRTRIMKLTGMKNKSEIYRRGLQLLVETEEKKQKKKPPV